MWTLITGFLVMFMRRVRAGGTGLCRGKECGARHGDQLMIYGLACWALGLRIRIHVRNTPKPVNIGWQPPSARALMLLNNGWTISHRRQGVRSLG